MNVVHQSAAAECGLACLAMVASFHGNKLDLQELRRRFRVSIKGVRLDGLMRCAGAIGLDSRALRLEVDELSALQLPAILHMDFDHFVVLQAVRGNRFVVLDPANGRVTLGTEEVSRRFTGVAVELTPRIDFKKQEKTNDTDLLRMFRNAPGLRMALSQLLVITAAVQAIALLSPLLNQIVVDDVLGGGDRELLRIMIAGFGLLMLTQVGIGLARSWCAIRLGQTLSLQWAGSVFGHLLRLPAQFFMERHIGDVVSKFGSVGAIQRTLTTSLVGFLMDLVMCVGAIAMMVALSPFLAAVVASAAALYAGLRWWMYRPMKEAMAESMVLGARENSYFIETLRAIMPLKLTGKIEARRARWQNLLVDVQNRDVRTAVLGMWSGSANALIFGVGNLAVFWFGVQLVMGDSSGAPGVLTVGMFFAFLAYKMQFEGRISAIIGFVVEVKMLRLHCERLGDIVLEDTEEPPEALGQRIDGAELPASIELKNVSFRYGDSEDWILKDVSLKIEQGECIAITGPSGSGKTTLLKIVLGLLEPTEGEVLYGGKKIRSIGFDGYRSLAGSVMQEDCLVQGTIYDNIALFDDVQDEARIKEAARKARVLAEIEKMPMGFNSLIGDLGSGLSGGQKQRVMLARALYRSPKFLVLDEATSHLDKENEESIAKELASMEITRLVVAHRKETVDAANRVVILFGGKLISDISKSSESAPEQLAVAKLSIADRVKAMLQESGLAQHPQLTAT